VTDHENHLIQRRREHVTEGVPDQRLTVDRQQLLRTS